jgi:putative transposase
MSDQLTAEERRTEIALFRYTLILPLLREPSARARQQMRRNLAAVVYDLPHSNRQRISVTTLRRWESRYRAGGFEALKPQPRSDRGQPRAVSPETLDRAEALKREQPFRSARSIAAILAKDNTQPIPEARLAPRTLRRQLAKRGATTAQLLTEQRPKAYRRFERSAFGDLWQGDAMHGPYLPDPAQPDQPRQVFLFAFLDDHTRLVPHAQFYWNEQLPRMEDCFKRAILRYGLPLAVYVDRGKVYTSKQFDAICATLGLQRILGTPYYPQGRGKIERFFQFVQSDFLPELARADVSTLSQLNQSLLAWLEVVYHRKVTKTATLSFQGNRYRVPDYLRGQSIELRYDPFDLSHLELWRQDTFLEMAQPDQLVHPLHPDLKPDPQPAPPPAQTGLDYLALLRCEHQRLIQAQLEGLHFSQLTQVPDPADENPEQQETDHDRP